MLGVLYLRFHHLLQMGLSVMAYQMGDLHLVAVELGRQPLEVRNLMILLLVHGAVVQGPHRHLGYWHHHFHLDHYALTVQKQDQAVPNCLVLLNLLVKIQLHGVDLDILNGW